MRDPRAQNNPNKNAAPEKLDRRSTGKILVRLGKYMLRHWYLILIAVAFTLLSNFLAILGPQFSGDAIDAIAAEGGVQMDTVIENVKWMVICYAVAAVLSYVLAATMIFLSQRIVYSMRKEIFEKLTTLPVGYFDTHATGDIISRISYDVDTLNSSLSHDLVQVMTSIYTVLGSLIFMWQISKPMILVFVITVPASIIFTRFRAKKVRPLFRERSRKLGELNGYAEEMLSGSKTIRAYNREGEIVSRFDKRNFDAVEAYYKAEYYGATLGPTVNFINNLSISLVTILGGILLMISTNGTVVEGSLFFITIGGISKFVQYSRKFAGPINEFANIMHEFQSAFSAADRIFHVLDEDPEKKDAEDAVTVKDVKGDVSLEHVKFGYVPEKTIIHDLTLRAKPGQTVAIVGPTGAGKTTVINLLMRFYDVNGGAILMDGQDIYKITRDSLRGSYTMVLQETWLFCGTIYENIAYGCDGATREQVIEAAKAARIHNYIESLPEGYDTVLSDDGVNISKGQKQLITIARAMLPKTSMLILDEATSNVDSRTEINIQKAMNKLMEGRTCFVIAHRLSTIKNADLIVVVKDGRITEMGSHSELMTMGGFYSTLYNSQFD